MIKVLHVLSGRVSFLNHEGANDSVDSLSIALKKKNSDQKQQNLDARKELVKRCVNVAEMLFSKYTKTEIDYEDLYQVASQGILNAIDRYDPRQELEFTGLVVSFIITEIKNHLRVTGWYARSPRRIKELSEEITVSKILLKQDLNRSAKISDVVIRLNCTEEEIIEAMETDWQKSPTPIERYKCEFMNL